MLETEMGFNTRLNYLKSNMVEVINKSGLPIGIVYYIVKDLFNDITNTYKETLLSELKDNKVDLNKNEN